MNELIILDEILEYLNTGNIQLRHANDFLNSYDKLSHKEIKKETTGFYLFHNELKNKMSSILKPYKLSCKLYGVYDNKNSLKPSRLATIIIEKGKYNDSDYTIQVAKLMSDFEGNKLVYSLNKLNNKVEVVDVNYCYTESLKIYSIDITYNKK